MPLPPGHPVLPSILGHILTLAFTAVLLFVVFRFRAFRRSRDRNRIVESIGERDGVLLDIARVFDPVGWLATKGSVRHYRVTYRTKSGVIVTTGCMTSFWTGVHWADGPPSVSSGYPAA